MSRKAFLNRALKFRKFFEDMDLIYIGSPILHLHLLRKFDCTTKVNDTHLMIIDYQETYLIDMRENFEVKEGPPLPKHRTNKQCGHLTYESKESWLGDLVVVISGESMYSWDTLYYTDWIEGPKPPFDMGRNCQTVIQRPNDEAMIFLGCRHENQTISAELRFIADTNEFQWTLRPFELQHERNDYVAMFIPDELSNCTNAVLATKIKVG